MPCQHRFIDDLQSNEEIDYLFIGTFNPSWDRSQEDNANWFYGRQYNDFWFIMPQVFNQQSLMKRQYRTNRQFLINWCQENRIGLTDLITSIIDADINNNNHNQIILNVKDSGFDEFHEIIPTNIIEIINENLNTLRGVYLTRYEHTLNQNGIIKQLWTQVLNRCIELQIQCHDLVTPSRQYRKLNRLQKLEEWRNIINR